MKFDDIDKALRNKLYDAQDSDAPSWEEFRTRQSRPSSSRSFPMRRYAAMVAALAACIILAVFFIQPSIENFSPSIKHHTYTTPKVSIATDNKYLAAIPTEERPTKYSIKENIKQSHIGDTESSIESTDLTKVVAIDQPKELPETEKVNQQPTNQSKKQDKIENKNYNYYNRYNNYTPQKSTRPLLAISAYASLPNLGANVNSQSAGLSTLGMSVGEKIMFIQVGQYNQVIAFAQSDFSHKLPLMLGVNFDLDIAKNLSLSTGLSYSYLHSSAQSITNSFVHKYKQDIHYIGIPLAASYRFLSNKVMNLYATVGVGFDFVVAQRGVNDTYHSGTLTSSQNVDMNNDVFQFSANAGVGINFNLTNRLGLYLEPGVSHYVKSDNTPLTYRTQSPLQFTLKAGFRFSW